MRLRPLLLPAAAAAVVAIVALALGHSRNPSSSGSATAVVHSKTVQLTISNYAYRPSPLVVTHGATIIVTNRDQTAHTATATSGAFDTGTVGPGQTKRFTLTKPGTYTFYCQFHAFMRSTITVVK